MLMRQSEIENSFLARMTPDQDAEFLEYIAQRIAAQ